MVTFNTEEKKNNMWDNIKKVSIGIGVIIAALTLYAKFGEPFGAEAERKIIIQNNSKKIEKTEKEVDELKDKFHQIDKKLAAIKSTLDKIVK